MGGAKAPARPAGRPGPCQGPRQGGVQGAAPLAHRFTSIQTRPRFGLTFIPTVNMTSSDHLSPFSSDRGGCCSNGSRLVSTTGAAQGAASEVRRFRCLSCQWRDLVPRLRRLGLALGGAAWAVPRPLVGPPGGQAPARAPGRAGFKGQRPLRTGSSPFKLGLALTASAQIRICVGCGSLVGA